MKPVLAIDAEATEHNLHQQDIACLKDIDVAYLLIQDEVGSKRLRERRVQSEENVADLGTTALSSNLEALHHIGVCQHGRRKG